MAVDSYRDLEVWKKALDLVVVVHEIAERLSAERRFVLSDQLRRAVLSIPANIAEGNGRIHRAEYAHHVSIARGSLLEVEALLFVAVRLGCVSQEDCKEPFKLVTLTGRMLTMLLRALRRPSRRVEQRDSVA